MRLILSVSAIALSLTVAFSILPAFALPDPSREFSPRYARDYLQTVLLGTGELLVFGGQTASRALIEVEIYNPATGAWRMAAPMTQAIGAHQSVLLPTGDVIVFGYDASKGERYNPTLNQWTPISSPSGKRQGAKVAMLGDGRVLVMGGRDPNTGTFADLSEIYDPSNNTWTQTSPMVFPHSGHSVSPLADGRVLVIGGNTPPGSSPTGVPECEIFDPTTGTWTATTPLIQARSGAKSILLPTGKVITFGGEDEYPIGAVKAVEVFDPATETWSPAPDMPEALADVTAALTPSGKIILAGGSGRVLSQDAVHVYDTVLQTWTTLPKLSRSSRSNAAVVLPDGKVLSLGGSSTMGGDPYPTVDVIDPIAGTVYPKFDRGVARGFHTATLMNDGKVLIAGGKITHDWSTVSNAATIYDPATALNTPIAPLNFARMRHSAVRMIDGRIMVAGGHTDGEGPTRYDAVNTVEIFNPATGAWTYAAPMAKGRQNAPLISLPDGRVIVIGGGTKGLGDTDHYFPVETVEIYDPLSDVWLAAAPMTYQRAGHSATLLPTGKIVVVGGMKNTWGPDECHNTVEIYDIATNTWSAGGSLAYCRYDQAAHLLSNGKIMIVGGMGPTATSPTKDVALDSCEAYDPASNVWTSEAPLPRAQAEPMSAVLSGDRVLVVGGDGEEVAPKPGAIYDYNTGQWNAIAPLDDARSFGTATLLNDGRVLIHGGESKNFGVLPFSEVL